MMDDVPHLMRNAPCQDVRYILGCVLLHALVVGYKLHHTLPDVLAHKVARTLKHLHRNVNVPAGTQQRLIDGQTLDTILVLMRAGTSTQHVPHIWCIMHSAETRDG